jgi:parallel beta helix pectate lyase-like protein
MRPLALLLSLLLSSALLAQHSQDLDVALNPLLPPESGTSSTLQLTLRNRTAVAIDDVDVDVFLSAARATLSATHHPAWPSTQWSCTNVTPQHVRCRADIGAGPDQFIPLMLTIDPVVQGRFGLTAQATWNVGGATLTSEPDIASMVLPREVLVTSAADAGPRTLRAAIETLNDTCTRDQVPCWVRFAIDEVIRPVTPLPVITASDFDIDGGAGVELDGSLLTAGHGLDIRGEGPAMIANLAIGGFPWDGIAVARKPAAGITAQTNIYNCRIGVRFDGTQNANGSRGVTLNAPTAKAWISSSVIGGNLRSGVFIDGASDVTVYQNVIGEVLSPGKYGNGASGVFIGPGSHDVELIANSIVGNAHFGVAIARGATGVHLRSTNRILANRLLPLDHGLDGFSGYAADAMRTPAPRITTAQYDAATETVTISGTLAVPDPTKQWTVTLYVPETVWTDLPLPTATVHDGTFSFSFKSHLTRSIEFMAYADSEDSAYSTSEFAETVFLP